MEIKFELLNLLDKCSEDDVPVSSVLINQKNEIVSTGFNVREIKKIISGHAEIEAINNYIQEQNNSNLSNLTLYSTLKPCLMCIGAIRASKIKKVYYLVDNKFNNYFLPEDIECIKINDEKTEDIIKSKLNVFFKKLR
ncbi:nucleoside deaminase [Spiroplasma endosymbiont of Crioceris asparagi]|uniref:nucleoside deaminase n=1 Tax=Spiroplasma endosymbiont of Crioceris asparagi TaxID=3066286 RepID=UPI0030D059AD